VFFSAFRHIRQFPVALTIASLAAFAALPARGAPIVPERFQMGISAHIGHHERGPANRTDGKSKAEIAVKELFADTVRDELHWWTSPEEKTERAARIREIARHGGKILLILAYNHDGETDGHEGFPDTRHDREAFLKYALDAIARIGPGNIMGIEIWNEWNLYTGWKVEERKREWDENLVDPPCPTDPEGDGPACPKQYAKLVRTLLYPEREEGGALNLKSIRQAAPGVPVIVGAVNGLDPRWSGPMLQHLKDMNVEVDGFSLHTYLPIHPEITRLGNSCNRRDVLDDRPAAAAYCVQMAKDLTAERYGRVLPIYVTEMGWSTFTANKGSSDKELAAGGYSRATQASYLVEFFVRTRAVQGVPGVWWYNLTDKPVAKAPDWQFKYRPTSFESNLGLLAGFEGADGKYYTGETKPSGKAFAALAKFWKECTAIDGEPFENKAFRLTCPSGDRGIYLDATSQQLRDALNAGWVLVDLSGTYPDVKPGSTVPNWVGRHVGIRPNPPDCTNLGTTIHSNHTRLVGGQCLISANGRYRFIMQHDGNVVIYDGGRAISAINTYGSNRYIIFQTDGDLVLYEGDWIYAGWQSWSDRQGGTTLTLQDDGDLVMYRPNGTVVWSWNKGLVSREALRPGQDLPAGQYLISPNGRYKFVMQGDGNAVIYDGGRAIWESNTAGPNRRFVFQNDGNLVIYAGSQHVWTAWTHDKGGTLLVMQDDGNLVLYTPAYEAVWASNTYRP